MKLLSAVVLLMFSWGVLGFPPEDFRLSQHEIEPVSQKGDPTYRLPENVIPSHYKIELTPDFENLNFAGIVTITAELKAAANTITLHSNNIEITKATVNTKDATFEMSNDDKHFLVLTLAEETTGPIEIVIEYTGILNNNKEGFYKVLYERGENIITVASTQFEPTYARQAFPCFDEPHLKATFEVVIHAPEGMTAICNTPLVTNSPRNTKAGTTFIFQTTVKMSTYLLAFAVTDFTKVEELTPNVHEVYARKEYIDDGRAGYALSLSEKVMAAIETFVNVPNYENKKMTQIAIPDDWFSAGAMENWGLVTYRETLVLHKDGLSTSAEKQRIANIVAHEYGHQWFGDLVSPDWWNFIWLNEGFATYFEHFAVNEIELNMRHMEQYVTAVLQYAMNFDQTENTRPITRDAWTPTEISNLFDRIAYEKAGSVLRMVEHMVGTEVFKAGLNQYLTDRKLDVAKDEHLWTAIQSKVSEGSLPMPLADIMKPWTEQIGVPLVTAVRQENGSIVLSQEHFVLSGEPLKQTWHIPITYSTPTKNRKNTAPMTWLSSEQSIITDIKPEDWFLLNNEVVNYYRVKYDDKSMDMIISTLKNNYEDVPAVTRSQLIDDGFNLAKAGKLAYNKLFNLLEYMKNETDYLPLYSFVQGVNHLEVFGPAFKNSNDFSKLITGFLQGALTKLGYEEKENDAHTDRLGRIILLQLLCKHGHADCLTNMEDAFTKKDRITPDSQSPVYCGAMRKNSTGLYSKLLDLYKSSMSEYAEKNRIISALGCANDQTVLVSLLTDAKNEIDPKHKMSLLTSVYTSSEFGLNVAIQYIIDNYPSKSKAYTEDQMKTAIRGICKRAVTAEATTKLRTLNEKLSDEELKNYVENNLKANAEWLKMYHDKIENIYIDENSKDKPDSSSMLQFSSILLTALLAVYLVL